MSRLRYLLIILTVVCALSACKNDPSNDAIPSDDDQELRTECGVVFDSQIVNPVARDTGEIVFGVALVEPDTFLVTLENTEELITLHGINGFPLGRRQEALDEVIRLFSQELRLFRPFKSFNCTVTTSRGQLTVGNLVTTGGRSIAEELLRRQLLFPVPATQTECQEELVRECYEALFFER